MKFKDGIVYFKSDSPFYDKEKSGVKNNTVRLLSESEYNNITWTVIEEIEISNPLTEQNFRRKLMDISRIGGLCGRHLIVFSWKKEEETYGKANKV